MGRFFTCDRKRGPGAWTPGPLFGGSGGIRTHETLRPTWFRVIWRQVLMSLRE